MSIRQPPVAAGAQRLAVFARGKSAAVRPDFRGVFRGTSLKLLLAFQGHL
jgi:hypothetical protein